MDDRSPALSAFDRGVSGEHSAAVCGVDEVGRGSLAGPVVAAAVVLADGAEFPGLDDSKLLTRDERESQAVAIRAGAVAIGLCFIGPRRIERTDIRRASLIAMYRAVERALHRGPVCVVLVDGVDAIPRLARPQRSVIGGDGTSLAIAAASVIAKTARDGFMRRLALEYPEYGFERHVGYGTPEHLAALERHGPCPSHRRTFAPVAQLALGLETVPPPEEIPDVRTLDPRRVR